MRTKWFTRSGRTDFTPLFFPRTLLSVLSSLGRTLWSQGKEGDAGALPASFFCLLPLSLLIHHKPKKVSQGEPSGSSSVTLSFPTFSKVWGVVLAPSGMGASSQSDGVGMVGWAGAKFFK